MKIGFIGLGIMGSRMAANLQKHGHSLVVFNRTGPKQSRYSVHAEHSLIPRQKLPIKWISYLPCWPPRTQSNRWLYARTAF